MPLSMHGVFTTPQVDCIHPISQYYNACLITMVGRQRRQAAILVEQAVVSQRAMKHAAWDAKKEIRSKLQTMKKSPYNASMRPTLPQITPAKSRGAKRATRQIVPKQEERDILPPTSSPAPVPKKSLMSPPVAGKSSVLATPVGFRKVREVAKQQATTTPPTSGPDPLLWKIGEDYGVFLHIIITWLLK